MYFAMSTKYCLACRRKHKSRHWYGVGVQYCTVAYTRMFRQGLRVCHPSWYRYEENCNFIDETGARICAAMYRHDVCAIQDAAVLLSDSMLSSRMRLLVILLSSTYYFSWPSQAFISGIVQLAEEEPSRSTLAHVGTSVFDRFSAYRVLKGRLASVPRSQGISCTKNPSERRCGSIRFYEILGDLPRVLALMSQVEAYFAANAQVSVSSMLKLFGKSCIYSSSPTYKNVRCCRILAEAFSKRFIDCTEDFSIYKRMSIHMADTLKEWGIADFATAMKFVQGMKDTIGLTTYSLNDFIIYTCLMSSHVFD